MSLGSRLKQTLRRKRPPSAKLDATIVAAIKRDLAEGVSQRSVSRKYGVPRGTVSSIALGLTWSAVEPLAEDGVAVT